METSVARPFDYAQLMRRVDQVVSAIEDSAIEDLTIREVVEAIISNFRDQLGIFGGRIYRLAEDTYVLQGVVGEAKDLPAGLTVSASYAPIQALAEERTIYMEADDPQLDPELEVRLGVREFAAIEVADQEYILSFDVAPGHDRDGIVYSLGILRSSINQKIRQIRMDDVLRQARKIQASITPKRMPKLGDFEIFGRSKPMEIVGGDYYDFIPLSEKVLGISIADVSGHGLPAALLVRDVYMGLRMGVSRDFKITRTVELLNDIIHQSRLTSRFVSLFYGELEPNGSFIYSNAGHPPPVHIAADGAHQLLQVGGAVLGPLTGATYERGFLTIEPGELLVLYTDGIIEAQGPGAEGQLAPYGTDRLLRVVKRNRKESAERIVAAIFDDLDRHGQGSWPDDDRTVVAVKRPV